MELYFLACYLEVKKFQNCKLISSLDVWCFHGTPTIAMKKEIDKCVCLVGFQPVVLTWPAQKMQNKQLTHSIKCDIRPMPVLCLFFPVLVKPCCPWYIMRKHGLCIFSVCTGLIILGRTRHQIMPSLKCCQMVNEGNLGKETFTPKPFHRFNLMASLIWGRKEVGFSCKAQEFVGAGGAWVAKGGADEGRVGYRGG